MRAEVGERFCSKGMLYSLRSSPDVAAIVHLEEPLGPAKLRRCLRKPAPGHRRGNARTDPTQPCEIGDARIADWARDSGRCLEAAAFGECLDGRQVEDELSYPWMHRDQQVRLVGANLVAGAEGDGRAAADGVLGGAELG